MKSALNIKVIQEWLGLGVYPRLLGARNLPALFRIIKAGRKYPAYKKK